MLVQWQPGTYQLVRQVTMIATPTFMIISGTMLGYLFIRSGPRWPKLSCKLVNRGLFLATVGHIATIPTFYLVEGDWWGAWMRVLNTDAIAFAVVFDAGLIAYLGVRWALVQGVALIGLCWLVLGFWRPEWFWTLFAKEVLFGADAATVNVLKSSAPLLPFLAMHHAAIPLGAWLARTEGSTRGIIIRRILLLGAAMLASSIMCWLLFQGLKEILVVSKTSEALLWSAFSPYAKKPPGLSYIMFYGGFGLLMLGCVWLVSTWPVTRWAVGELSVIGRSSFFVFMLQWWVYGPVAHALDLGRGRYWPWELGATIIVIFAAAKAWVRLDGNRWLTLGWRCRGAE
jgi:hypothetical protein